MKTTINEHDFIEAFKDAGRENQFSREGLIALFDYLEELEQETGEETELDVIALCCRFAEYKSFEAFRRANGNKYESIEELESDGQVIRIDDESFIVEQF